VALAEIQVQGLQSLVRAAAKISKDASKEVRGQLIKSAQPTVADAQSRMRGLGGYGPKAATTIRLEVQQRGVAFRLGSPSKRAALGTEFGALRTRTRSTTFRNQFGKGITFQGQKRIPYARPSIFGPWTGNQFTVDPGTVSGRAFYPAIASGVQKTTKDIEKVVEGWAATLAAAGKLGD
jgi:hypothetical protein